MTPIPELTPPPGFRFMTAERKLDQQRQRRRDPLRFAKPATIERFWKLVDKTPASGCWLWTGPKTKRGGYGESSLGQAHRVAFLLTVGPIGHGLFVCHRCDTPLCVNPAHLFLGTNNDNVADMIGKGRQRSKHSDSWKNGRCQRGHDVTRPEGVITQRIRGIDCRTCRACHTIARKKYLNKTARSA